MSARLLRFGISVALVAALGIANSGSQSASATTQDCSVVPETSGFWIDKWANSSGWKSLSTDPAMRSRITGLQLRTDTSVPAGTAVHFLENWAPVGSSIALPSGPWTAQFVPLPAGSNKTLQFWMENTTRTAMAVEARLCVAVPAADTTTTTGSTTTTTVGTSTTAGVTTTRVTTTVGPISPAGIDRWPLKSGLPPVEKRSTQYTSIRNATQFTLDNWAAIQGTSGYKAANKDRLAGSWAVSHPTAPTQACVDLHDRHWTYGPDGKAYHTWHPATVFNGGIRCDFGHEHGNDPTKSNLLAEFGGIPPFGYVAEQHHNDPSTHINGEHRHEDHVGHKVTVSNNWEAAYGLSTGLQPKSMRAGFRCDFISKLHQGSYSDDAFTNHLHEYFVALRCNDAGTGISGPSGQGTFFSVKLMVPFGYPNQFKDMNITPSGPETDLNRDQKHYSQGGRSVWLSKDTIIGLDGQPLTPTRLTGPLTADTPPNNREFVSPSSWLWKDLNVTRKGPDALGQVDLWTQIINVAAPGKPTAVTLGSYYIVKNPVRYYDHASKSVKRTVDLCYGTTQWNPQVHLQNFKVCQEAPTSPTAWNDPRSPFDGTLRAVNFKALTQANNGGVPTWCTNVFGQAPTAAPTNGSDCPGAQVKQYASTVNNYADQANPGATSRCKGVVCGIGGSTLNADVDDDGSFTPQDLGFELIVDQRRYSTADGDAPQLEGQSKVIYGAN
jgi:hypothetical protein